jgi:5-methylcytosine-specific restriction protein A
MEQSRQAITSFSEALDNAVHFQEYLKNNEALQHKLSQYTHWYYFEKKNIFAPSKFIGYKNNTYNSESHHEGDGRETEKALAPFFKKLRPPADQQDYFINQFYDKLKAMLAKYNKKLKSNAVIHILKEHNRK